MCGNKFGLCSSNLSCLNNIDLFKLLLSILFNVFGKLSMLYKLLPLDGIY